MKKIALFSLVIFVFATGCREIAGERIRGSGHIITENRSVSEFNSIDVSGAIDVYVRQDSATSVKVEADDNILEYIEVHTEGSRLEIYTQHNIRLRPSNKIKVYISNPQYKEIQVSGASSIRSENEITSADVIEVHLSGASDGRLELNAPKISVRLTGASNTSIKGKTKDFEGGGGGGAVHRVQARSGALTC